MRSLALIVALFGAGIAASPQAPPPGAAVPTPAPLPPLVTVKPIDPPPTPLPDESASAGVTRFSFIAYGDTRSGTAPDAAGDGQVLHPLHNLLVDGMLAKATELASTPFPLRFVVHSGDAVLRGVNGAMWNVSYSPIVERLTHAGIPYFFSAGNHDVTGMPVGDRGRAQGLHNALAAMSRLLPPEGSPRRLSGYPTYAFGYGNVFVIALDSNIASDRMQLAWVANQLEGLDRKRFEHVIAVFHHPIFSSGPHGGRTLEPATVAIRELYAPLFRRHHVRMTIAGHDHLLDHWVERYDVDGAAYRRDDIVTGGGGAPLYAYDSEPALTAYLAAGAEDKLRVEHLMRPGPTQADNPHHFLVIQVDGARISVEAVAIGGRAYAPYAGQARLSLGDRAS